METFGMTKQDIYKILLTAVLSALLAIIQNLLVGLSGHASPVSSPEVAGAFGALIHGISTLKNKC